jgi:putative transcriptional regulator
MNKDKFNKKLGKNVCDTREKKKLSKLKLSNSIGKSYRSLISLEKGKLNPSYYFLLEIAKGLEVPISELTKGLK